MIQSKNKRGAAAALIACAALLAVIVLLENASVFLPASNVPNLLKPTIQLFAVLKKGAVYSLAAVSMNLLNG